MFLLATADIVSSQSWTSQTGPDANVQKLPTKDLKYYPNCAALRIGAHRSATFVMRIPAGPPEPGSLVAEVKRDGESGGWRGSELAARCRPIVYEYVRVVPVCV